MNLLPALALCLLLLARPAVAQIGPPELVPPELVPQSPPEARAPSPAALSERYLGSWQGTWVGPDGNPNSGVWPGDLLTPDGRAVGEAEFAHFEGTAFVIIHPTDADTGPQWAGSWLGDCHNKLYSNEYFGKYGGAGLCESWLRYYRRSGLVYQGWSYAVPVTLALSTRPATAGCQCRTVTTRVVTEYIRAQRGRFNHRGHRHSKTKLIRPKPSR